MKEKKERFYSIFGDGGYYRGRHGEIRRKNSKPTKGISKKRRRQLRKMAKERFAEEMERRK